MPINSPDVFCFQIKLKETNVTVNPQPFTDIGKINKVAGFSCALGSNPGVLDKYPGAAAAYSLRKLSNTYSGSAVEVNNGISVADIGFDSNGNLDLVALGAHCGARDGTISKWYDQTSNGNDLIQSTPSDQPKIYDSIEGVVMQNSRPSITFTSTTGNMSGYDPASGNISFFCAVNSTASSGANSIFGTQGWSGTSSGNWFIGVQNTFRFFTDPGTASINASITENQMFIGSAFQIAGSKSIFADGSAGTTGTGAATSWTGSGTLSNTTAARGFAGNISEVIIYEGNQSSNRTDIEADLNTYYAVYNQSPTGLLGSYPGASIALSLRQLKSTSNYAIAVKRSSADNAITSIGFDANGGLDTAALAAFCGSDDGFITVIYDQSGNGNDSVQNNAVLNPKIYDGTTGVIVDNNNLPTMQFDGDNQDFRNEIFFRSNAPEAFLLSIVAAGKEAGLQNGEYFGGQTVPQFNFLQTVDSIPPGDYRFRHTNDANTGNINQIFAYPTPEPVAGETALLNVFVESEIKKMHFNGQLLSETGNDKWRSTDGYKLNLGTIGSGYSSALNLNISELIAWPNQNGVGLSEIQTNTNTFYSIY